MDNFIGKMSVLIQELIGEAEADKAFSIVRKTIGWPQGIRYSKAMTNSGYELYAETFKSFNPVSV